MPENRLTDSRKKLFLILQELLGLERPTSLIFVFFVLPKVLLLQPSIDTEEGKKLNGKQKKINGVRYQNPKPTTTNQTKLITQPNLLVPHKSIYGLCDWPGLGDLFVSQNPRVLLLLSLLLESFFTSTLADSLLLEFEWQQVSTSLQDSSRYSSWSQ